MISLCVISFVVVFLRLSQATDILRNYNPKLEFDNKKSDDELLGECAAHSLCECAAMCHNDCNFFGYSPILKKCRVHKKILTSASEMSDEVGWRYYSRLIPVDCKDLRADGHTKSGVYDIYPYGTITSPIRVYCDMETMDGGWTAIQKRVDGSQSFNQNWAYYKNGFGAPELNVWIGNDVIHQLTKERNSFLYVSITLQNGTRLYEVYDRFSVSNEAEKYKLFLAGNATGTLGDSMRRHDLSGMYFSTSDQDNDKNNRGNCAVIWGGGWWFNYCTYAFLNGPWYPAMWTYPWSPTVEYGTSVRETTMLIKRH